MLLFTELISHPRPPATSLVPSTIRIQTDTLHVPYLRPASISVKQALLGLHFRLFLSLLVCFSWSRPLLSLTLLPSSFFLLFRARGTLDPESASHGSPDSMTASPSPACKLSTLPVGEGTRQLDQGPALGEGELTAAGVLTDAS